MHLLIAHAAPAGPQCQAALDSVPPLLKLPHLTALLSQLSLTDQRNGSPESMTPLHERIRAQSEGLDGPDGLMPWAAQEAQSLGLEVAGSAWAWITPCHWQINTDHVVMLEPQELALTAQESSTLMEAMREYFAEDGITLYPSQCANRVGWLAQGEVFRGLATASLERARGAIVDRWMPRESGAKVLRRLQNEMQMLLYRHPVNDARLAAKQSPVNSFWISGTGDLPTRHNGKQSNTAPALNLPFVMNDDLRASSVQDDAAAWLLAWEQLDHGLVKPLLDGSKSGKSVQLTLCGDIAAFTYSLQPQSFWKRIQLRLSPPSVAPLLTQL